MYKCKEVNFAITIYKSKANNQSREAAVPLFNELKNLKKFKKNSNLSDGNSDFAAPFDPRTSLDLT